MFDPVTGPTVTGTATAPAPTCVDALLGRDTAIDGGGGVELTVTLPLVAEAAGTPSLKMKSDIVRADEPTPMKSALSLISAPWPVNALAEAQATVITPDVAVFMVADVPADRVPATETASISRTVGL